MNALYETTVVVELVAYARLAQLVNAPTRAHVHSGLHRFNSRVDSLRHGRT